MLVTNRSSPTSWMRSPIRSVSALPAVPVLLVHPVLDREDRVAVAEVGPVGGHLLRREVAALVLELVDAVLEDLAGGRVERDRDVLAGRVAGRLDALDQRLQRRLVGVQVGREAALVADRRAEPALAERLLERVEDLRARAQRLRERRRADRHDHELLEVDGVVGVRAAVEHVHHRHGQHVRRLAAEVAPQRRAAPRPRPRGRRPARRRGSRWRRAATCWRAVEVDQRAVERPAGRARRSRRPRSAISPLTLATACVTPLPP